IDINLIKILSAGPDVSLKGSPTVSPITADICATDPLPPIFPASIYFLALSHAPPLFAINSASKTPTTVEPTNTQPRTCKPSVYLTITGTEIVITPGRTISCNDALVL